MVTRILKELESLAKVPEGGAFCLYVIALPFLSLLCFALPYCYFVFTLSYPSLLFFLISIMVVVAV